MPADDGIGTQTKPAQPPAESKAEPEAMQPATPADPATQPGTQPSGTTNEVFPVDMRDEAFVPFPATVAAAGVAPVDEEGVSNQTWIATAATVLAAIAGYPLYRWYQKIRQARHPMLIPAARA
jgi:hypothetical protein